MGNTRRGLSLLFVVILAVSSLIMVESANAQLSWGSQFTPNQDWNLQTIDPYGEGGQIVFGSHNTPHVLYYVEKYFGQSNTGINYAQWVNGRWVTSNVSKDGVNGYLLLDSADEPQIIYQIGNAMELATWNGSGWTSNTLNLPSVGRSYLAAESNGKLSIAFSNNSYSNGATQTDWYYVTQNSLGWTFQKIDSKLSDYGTIGSMLSSLVIDSKGLPHIVYGDYVEYHFPAQVNSYGVYTAYDVKYATLDNGNWVVQTVAKNATALVGCISNLAFNSQNQPSLCYIQDNNFTYFEQWGSLRVEQTMNYAYLNGANWKIEQIDPTPFSFTNAIPYLKMDTSGNPQAFYFRQNYQNENETGLVYATKTGSNWTTQLISQYGYRDLKIDSLGDLHVTVDSGLGSYHGNSRYANLTYATLSSSYLSPSPSPAVPELSWLAIVPLLLSVFSIAVIFRRRKIISQNKPNI
jgi:hypothetical protein